MNYAVVIDCSKPVKVFYEPRSTLTTYVVFVPYDYENDQKVLQTFDFTMGLWKKMPYFESYISGERKFVVGPDVELGEKNLYLASYNNGVLKMYYNERLILQDSGTLRSKDAVLCAFDEHGILKLNGFVIKYKYIMCPFAYGDVIKTIYDEIGVIILPEWFLDLFSDLNCFECVHDKIKLKYDDEEFIYIGKYPDLLPKNYIISELDLYYAKVYIASKKREFNINVYWSGNKLIFTRLNKTYELEFNCT